MFEIKIDETEGTMMEEIKIGEISEDATKVIDSEEIIEAEQAIEETDEAAPADEAQDSFAEETAGETFKTTLMGGYDKEDVQRRFKEAKAAAEEKEAALQQTIVKKDKEIARLKQEIELIRSQMSDMDNVEEKYRTYVDNVDIIGRIIADSRIQYEQTIKEADSRKTDIISKAEAQAASTVQDAEKRAERKIAEANSRANDMIMGAQSKSDDMLNGAQAKAEAMIAAANESVNEKLQEGAGKYITIQEEVGSLVSFANKIQKEFMQSIKKINEISDSMNVSIDTDSDFDEN